MATIIMSCVTDMMLERFKSWKSCTYCKLGSCTQIIVSVSLSSNSNLQKTKLEITDDVLCMWLTYKRWCRALYQTHAKKRGLGLGYLAGSVSIDCNWSQGRELKPRVGWGAYFQKKPKNKKHGTDIKRLVNKCTLNSKKYLGGIWFTF